LCFRLHSAFPWSYSHAAQAFTPYYTERLEKLFVNYKETVFNF